MLRQKKEYFAKMNYLSWHYASTRKILNDAYNQLLKVLETKYNDTDEICSFRIRCIEDRPTPDVFANLR